MTTTHLKIAHVIARLNMGGPAVAVVAAVNGLRDRGHDVLLLSGEVPASEASMEYLVEQSGLELRRISRMSRNLSWWRDLASFWRLWRIFRQERPHVVHTHTAKAGTLGRLAAMCAGVPVRVHTFHGHVFRGYFSRLVTNCFIAIERWLARHSDCIIALSESQRQDLVEVFRIASTEKVVTVPLGFDLEPYLGMNQQCGTLRTLLQCPTHSPLIGWIGRLTAIKAPELFIESAAAIHKSVPRARYAMVGDGELRSHCEQAIRSAGLQSYVSLAGWQRHMENVYADLDIVVLTSLNEGTPLALLEAMSAGRPFVAVDVGGVRDLMAAHGHRQGELEVFENGVLAPRDPHSLAHAVCYLLERVELRESMGEAGKQFAASRFARQRMVDDLQALYSRILRLKSGMHQPASVPASNSSVL